MFKKFTAILVIALMVIGLATGCGNSNTNQQSNSNANNSSSEKAITLKLWHLWPEQSDPGSPHQMLLKIAEQYHKLHPNVTIQITGNTTQDKLLTALSGGAGPDIFLNFWNNTASWSDKGALLDLTQYVNNDSSFNKDDILPAAWKLSTYKDKIYGIPFAMQSSEIYYNKDLLKQAGFDGPPETMEDLIDMAYKLTKTDSNGNIIQLGFLPDYPWLDNVLWPVVYGAQWIDTKTNKITFDSPEMIAAYQWQADIYKKYGPDKIQKFKSGFGADAQSPIYTGKLAMMFNGEWQIGGFEKYAPNMNWGIAPMPYPKDHPELKGSTFLSSNVWQISSNTKYKDEAWKFLSYLTNEENMKLWASGDGTSQYSLMSRKSALDSLPDKAPEQLKEVAKMVQSPNVRSFPMLPYINEYLTLINDEMQKTLLLQESVQDAAKIVQEKAQQLADQYPINK